MKKSILILVAVLSFTACDFLKDRPSDTPHSYRCEKPGDIPDTLGTGETIYWDCEWQGKYNNGDVKVKYNEDGTARAIVIFKSE
jgi:hypothetical protein